MKTVVGKNKISLKGLQAMLEQHYGKRQAVLFQINTLNTQLRQHNKDINHTEKMIRLMRQGELTVTDHAKLRYLERVEAINPADVVSKILTPQLREMVKTLGDGKYPVDDFQVVVSNNSVITVIKK
jgi:hypothetical protein